LAAVSPVRAEDDAKLRAIITKAIKVHGGADKLTKLKGSITKTKGTFYGLGDGIEYTQTISIQLPNRIRVDVDAPNFKFVQVFNGDKGWHKFGDNTTDMTKEQVTEAKEQMQAATITHLAVLTDKAYKLSALGETKVGDRAAVGVRVEREGHRPVSLFFDKDNSLLLKTETRGKDTMADGKEFTAESLYSDHKKVDGLMVPYKIEVKRDGKKFVESEVTEVKFSEKLDDSVFAKP